METYIYAFLFCGLVCMLGQLILDNTKKHIKILKKVQDNIIVFPNNNFSEETLTILKNMIKNEIAKG